LTASSPLLGSIECAPASAMSWSMVPETRDYGKLLSGVMMPNEAAIKRPSKLKTTEHKAGALRPSRPPTKSSVVLRGSSTTQPAAHPTIIPGLSSSSNPPVGDASVFIKAKARERQRAAEAQAASHQALVEKLFAAEETARTADDLSQRKSRQLAQLRMQLRRAEDEREKAIDLAKIAQDECALLRAENEKLRELAEQLTFQRDEAQQAAQFAAFQAFGVARQATETRPPPDLIDLGPPATTSATTSAEAPPQTVVDGFLAAQTAAPLVEPPAAETQAGSSKYAVKIQPPQPGERYTVQIRPPLGEGSHPAPPAASAAGSASAFLLEPAPDPKPGPAKALVGIERKDGKYVASIKLTPPPSAVAPPVGAAASALLAAGATPAPSLSKQSSGAADFLASMEVSMPKPPLATQGSAAQDFLAAAPTPPLATQGSCAHDFLAAATPPPEPTRTATTTADELIASAAAKPSLSTRSSKAEEFLAATGAPVAAPEPSTAEARGFISSLGSDGAAKPTAEPAASSDAAPSQSAALASQSSAAAEPAPVPKPALESGPSDVGDFLSFAKQQQVKEEGGEEGSEDMVGALPSRSAINPFGAKKPGAINPFGAKSHRPSPLGAKPSDAPKKKFF